MMSFEEIVKNKKHLPVFGCSFSTSQDDNLVESGYTFGDVIANHYGMKFHELGIPGSANSFIQKIFFKWFAQNRDKIDSTFVVVAWSDTNRLMFWNNKKSDWMLDTGMITINDDTVTRNRFAGDIGNEIGSLINTWTYEERKRYVQNFLHNDYSSVNNYIEQIVSVQSFLKLNNIPYIMFNSLSRVEPSLYYERNGTFRGKDDKPTINKLMWDNLVDKTFFYEIVFKDFINWKDKKLRMVGDDCHPNKEGHKIWGDHLIELIKEL